MTLDGSKLVKYRKLKGWSQGELARQAGLDQAIISRMEAGKQRNPTVRTLSKLAEVLDVNPEDLLVTEAPPQTQEPAELALTA